MKTIILKFLTFSALMLNAKANTQPTCEKKGLATTNSNCDLDSQPFQPCNNFDTTFGNPTMKTNLFILGESHVMHYKTAECIKALTKGKKEFIIYSEGLPYNQEFNCSEINLINSVGQKCMGWDDMTAHTKIMEMQAMQEIISNRKFDQAIFNLRKTFKGYTVKGHAVSDNDFNDFLSLNLNIDPKHSHEVISALKWLLNEHKKGMAYNDIFSAYQPLSKLTPINLQNENDRALYKYYNEEREISLVKTIKNHSSKFFGVLVSGVSHTENNGPEFENSGRIQAALENHIDPDKIARLKMKNSRTLKQGYGLIKEFELSYFELGRFDLYIEQLASAVKTYSSDKQYTTELKSVLEEQEVLGEKQQRLNQQFELVQAIKWVLSERATGRSYRLIFSTYQPFLKNKGSDPTQNDSTQTIRPS